MAVVLVHQGPSITQEKYEEVVRKLTDGKSLWGAETQPGDERCDLRRDRIYAPHTLVALSALARVG